MQSGTRRNRITLVVMLAGLVMTTELLAVTNYVTTTGTGGGASWADATSLTNALQISQSNDVIWLEQGTYTNTATFTIASNGVSLYGGFTNGMATLAERNWTSYPAILDGKAQNIRVVTISGAGVMLDGLVITNTSGTAAGGISKTTAGALTLANCRIVNHVRTGDSSTGIGAQFGGGASVLMTNCVVARNSATQYYILGFGVYSVGADLQIVDCVISNQYGAGWDTRSAAGVGLYFNQGQLGVIRSVFANNTADANHPWGIGGGGSAVYLGNHATFSASFSNCVFRGNAALSGSGAGYGAAVWAQVNAAKTAEFANCTFAYNTNYNGNGGAFYLSSGTVALRNSTLAHNASSQNGGGVYIAGGTLLVRNSILWTNRLTGVGYAGRDIYASTGAHDVRYSTLTGRGTPQLHVVAGASVALSSVMTNDPLFASAADLHVKSPSGRWENGSYVTTDTVYSPCIDAGDPSDPVGLEPSENGNRRNVGAYGGTVEASRSPGTAPEVANRTPVVESYTRMIVKGELTNSTATIATVGLCYGTNSISGETTNGWQYVTQFYPPWQTGSVFSVTTSFLVTNTTYYYRAYATNGNGGNWAPVESFVTGSEYPAGWGVGGGSNVIHVKSGATGEGDGRDWYNAYATMVGAATAISGTRTNIWVAGGTYAESDTITLASPVTVLGGFAGTETSADGRDWSARPVLLNGQGGNRRVVTVTATNVVLDGLVLTNTSGAAAGGIIKTTAGALTLANCRIVNHVRTGAQTTGIGAQFGGGASVFMTNCVVARNSATDYGVYGFGVYSVNADLQVVDCVISNQYGNGWDTRDARGVGLFFNQGALQVHRSTFVDNRADANHTFNGGGGSAVYLGNHATFSALFSNCVFRGNAGLLSAASANAGAAVWAQMSSTKTSEFVNCVFSGNTNQNGNGGAFYISSGTVRLRNSTLVGNASSQNGGCVYLAGGTLSAKNCILWTNRLTGVGYTGSEIYNNAGAVSVSFSDLTGVSAPHISGSATFSDCKSSDPLFASATDFHLQSPAGRWLNGSFVTTDSEYSPCIDAGDPADLIGNEPTDNGNSVINMGMYGGTDQASKSPPRNAPLLADCGSVVNANRARVSAEITNASPVSATVYLCYGTSSVVGDTTNGWGAVTNTGTRDSGYPFAVWTPALSPNTTYHYRWYAANNDGSNWTAAASFLTGELPVSGGSDVIHVDRNATGAADGSSWAHAFSNVAPAAGAVTGTRTNIWIAAGTYPEIQTITLASPVTVLGGFAGTETSADGRDWIARPVLLSGQAQNLRVVTVTGTNVVLDGLVLTNTSGAVAGGIIKTTAGALTLANCRIVNHVRTASGTTGIGAQFGGGASVLMTNCVVARNSATDWGVYGFGVYSAGADLQMADCVISNQYGVSYDTRSATGVGLCFDQGQLLVSRSVFLDNAAGANHPFGNNGGGSAVFLGSSATFAAVFSNCVFRGNAGLVASSAGYGAAVWAQLNSARTAEFVNCTFAYNTNYNGNGGAFYVQSGTVALRNSILWNNGASGTGSESYVAGGVLGARYSLLTGTNGTYVVTAGGGINLAAGMLVEDPRFASATDLHLKSRGGRWDPGPETWVRDAENSPCIDAGDPADSWSVEPVPNGGRINMGAYGGTAQASRTMLPGSVFRFR